MDEKEKEGLRKLNRNINQVVQQAFSNLVDKGVIDPDVFTPRKFAFPDGLKSKYWKRFKRKPSYKKWLFCYSSTKNKNGKYVSWIYWPVNDGWNVKRAIEHKKKKDAIKRAYKLYSEFK